MVSRVSRSWNSLYPSLLQMYEKLVELGLVYVDGEVVYPEAENEKLD